MKAIAWLLLLCFVFSSADAVAENCPYFKPLVLKPGTWIAVPPDNATPGDFSVYERKEIVCTIFGYHREDAERFFVQATLLRECEAELEKCVMAVNKEPPFFSTMEGRVVLAAVGVVTGVLLTVAMYETVRR